MMQDRLKINHALGVLGLAQLDNEQGFLSQVGFLVEDHDHFRSLLTKCEPGKRRDMYEALKPNLRFEAKPLDQYLSEAADQADREQLPLWDSKTQTFKAHNTPRIETPDYLAELLGGAVAKHVLTIVCKKCTREESFSGMTKADAVQKARDAGWVYSTLGEGIEICPECPAIRKAA